MKSFLWCLMLLAIGLSACHSDEHKTAGSTGAFGVVKVNGKQKLYLPLTTRNQAGHGVIAVVDVGLSGNGANGAPALMTDIDLGTEDYATTTGGDSTLIIAASTDNRGVWFIDPKTDTLLGTLQLDNTFGRSSFSGGGGYVTGVAADSDTRRAILSTWNGFVVVDMDRRSLVRTILAAPAENFGYDSVRQLIVAPFYDCPTSTSGTPPPCNAYRAPDGSTITHGLNIIDLKDDKVYTYQDAAAANPRRAVGSEPDSAAIDPTTGIAVIPSEGDDWQNVIDLSKAQFDKSANTVTAPHKYIQNLGLTGVAIEPESHLGFWEEEHSQDVAVMNVQDANQGASTYLHALMPNLPDGTRWANLGDPHGIAVSTGITDGRSVGFVVNRERKWVGRVDLAKMTQLAHLGTEIQQTAMSSVVTYLDARTKL